MDPGGGDLRNGGLAGARGAVKDHVGDGAPLDYPAEKAVLSQYMPLPHHLIQGFGAQFISQRTVHGGCLLSLVYGASPWLPSGGGKGAGETPSSACRNKQGGRHNIVLLILSALIAPVKRELFVQGIHDSILCTQRPGGRIAQPRTGCIVVVG